MTIRVLTADGHHKALARLVALGRQVANHGFRHSPYSNLMISFLLHEVATAESILALHRAFGNEWFPVSGALAMTRTLFEVDVNAHYISQDPDPRALRYIEFGAVLTKRKMDSCSKHRASTNASWGEGMKLAWQHHWAPIETEVNAKYDKVKSKFQRATKGGKPKPFASWSGMKLREMACAVRHEESYDVFYSDLSSFAHADVNLANRFLRLPPDGPVFTQRSDEGDVGEVFRYAAIFLTCFLELIGSELKLWTPDDVKGCWNITGIERAGED